MLSIVAPAFRKQTLIWPVGLLCFLLVLLLGDPFTARVWATTLALGFSTAAVAIPFGAAYAWLVWRSGARGRRIALALGVAWLAMPLYLQAAAWQAAIDDAVGTGSMGSWRSSLTSGFLGAWWVHAAAAIPWSAAAFSLAIFYLPRSWEEQAWLEPSPRRAWWAVTWPHWAGAVSVSLVWVLLVTSTDITATDLFQVRTFAELIYLQFALGDSPSFRPFGWESMLIISWLVLSVAHGVCHVLAPVGEAVERVTSSETVHRTSWWVTAAMWGILLFWIGVPSVVLVTQAGMEYELIAGEWAARWSAAKVTGAVLGIGPDRRQFVAWQFGSEWAWSAGITVTGSAVTVILASLLAWLAHCYRLAGGLVLLLLASVWVIPSPQWGIWLAAIFTATDADWLFWAYDRTIAAPVLAGMLRALPLATFIWWAGFRHLPRHLREAAWLGGWGFWRQWLGLALPARIKHLPLLAGLAGAIIFAEVGATLPVIPPGMLTITVRIFDLLHAGVDDLAAAICLFLGVVVTLPAVLAGWVGQRLR